MKRPARRGTVLIVVMGVLAVLSLLAVTFAEVQSMERRVARNFLDGIRARLLAKSGVEQTMAELSQLPQRNLIPSAGPEPWRYWGDDVGESGAGSTNVALRLARNPSFAAEVDGNPTAGPVTPRQVLVQGSPRGFSGLMDSGTYARHGDQYALKVSDASGKIFINEGVTHYQSNGSTASLNLRRILNRLGAAAAPPVPNLGDRIIANRPTGGYQAIGQLKSFLSSSEYERVADFLAVQAWVDPNVANPVPFSAARAQAIAAEFGVPYHRGTPAIYRFGRGKDYAGAPLPGTLQVYPATSGAPFAPTSLTHAVYAMDELNPQWIEVTSRAPVNVNAAPREVLVALLSDLRGVFLSERRRNNLEATRAGAYHYPWLRHTYSQASPPTPTPTPSWLAGGDSRFNVPEGDELGFLYETYPIVGPGSTSPGISAVVIANEIIACRRKQISPATGYDYGTAPFGGPFRTWRQFNAFCDNLVAQGVLQDPRPIFYDYSPTGATWSDMTGHGPLVPSDFQRQTASRAIADVLKANFNPNLHLNELNPDRNLFALVDKTDLVVHSTEFIFTPTGYFDIESSGRVRRPSTGDDALAPGVDNEIVAEAEIHAGVRLFTLVRETSQKHFIAGTCAVRTAGSPTNNNRSLETGPEPDNGNGPSQNAWDGYVALPTVGGNYRQAGQVKASGALLPTPSGGSDLGETIHTHLSWDFDAHCHVDGRRMDLGSRDDVDAAERVQNFPDPDPSAPTVRGPYDPTDNGGNYYRLARSFELPPASSVSASLPVLSVRAPMDLRIDGGYIERHSGLAYWISPTSYAANTARKEGVISYWVKPNFFPERSGKPRLYADMNRRNASPSWLSDVAFFTNLWTPSHNTAAGVVPTNEGQSTWAEGPSPSSSPWGVIPFKPQAMVFGVGYGGSTGMGDGAVYYQFGETPSLNHLGHGHAGTSYFKGHEWTHILLVWSKCTSQIEQYWPSVPSWRSLDYKIMVNGRLLPGFLEGVYRGGLAYERDAQVDWTVHANGDRNALRIGSPSRIDSRGPHYDNFSADSTVDEIFFWNRRAYENAALSLWTAGRYSRPRTADEGTFTSRPITLPASPGRVLPPASSAVPTGPANPPSPPVSAGPAIPAQILGMSWTWFAEDPQLNGSGQWVPTLTDHGSAGGRLYPTVEAWLVGLTSAAVTDDGYSPLRDASGNPIQVPAATPVQYRLKIGIPAAGAGTILLTTPVVDDVTLYVSAGGENVYTYYYLVTL